MSKKGDVPRRGNGREHLSDCLLLMAYEMDWEDREDYRCTCDDWYPDL